MPALEPIATQDELLTALIQLRHAAATIKHANPAFLDSVMLSTPETGPLDSHKLLDAVAFDLRLAQCSLANHRAKEARATFRDATIRVLEGEGV